MVTKVLKLVGIIIASLAIVALVLTAVNMDVDTGFVAAGKKWINDFAEATTGKQAFIEEYVAATDKATDGAGIDKDSEDGTEIPNVPAKVVNTQADETTAPADDLLDEQRAIVYGEKSGISMISDDEASTDTFSHSSGQSQHQAFEQTETVNENTTDISGDSDGQLPMTYDEFTLLSLEEKIAIAEYLGDDYDAWVKNLEAHQDDGYIIISAGNSVEELE